MKKQNMLPLWDKEMTTEGQLVHRVQHYYE